MAFIANIRESRDLLVERNFGLLLLGQLVSQLGENLNKVALFWFVYLFTKSPQAMIIVGVLQTLPPMLFFWANGVMLDRCSKRNVMIAVDAVRGLLVLLIPLLYALHHLSLPILYLLVFLIATASGIFGPALYSAIPLMVHEPRRVSANALMQTTGQVGILVGPLLGGVLSALYNPVFVMIANGMTFLVSALFLLLIRIREVGGEDRVSLPGFAGILAEVGEGVRFVFSGDRLLLGLFVIMTLYGLITGPVTLLLPILSHAVLHAGSQGFGMLLSAYGVGMLLASLALTVRPPKNLFRWIATGFLAGGILILLVSASRQMAVDLLLMALFGMAVSLVNPLVHTLLQNHAPARLLSRVLTTMSLGFLGGAILGMTGLPSLVTAMGIQTVLMLLGGVLILSWAAVNLIEAGHRSGRTFGRPVPGFLAALAGLSPRPETPAKGE
ncbi:MAG: MFS transporter [Nitrospirae bacterium]|nr:MFS transporter [Nitrospirota bacterium]MCL5284518.1 MFS transporter [Nitrospirota bacterium]